MYDKLLNLRQTFRITLYFLHSFKYQAVKVCGERGADERQDAFLASAEDEGEWLEEETMVPLGEKVGWIHRRSAGFEVRKILYPCCDSNVGPQNVKSSQILALIELTRAGSL